ncbi:hypothetical protein M408DRAFT_331556 [Serendipita vermifera MAFF 305830]|uniref:RING-type domain-containing protein n=1 Tax=Serendipita vermifera MAFF 305830 TaxID=933852 RepID=A0A0C2X6F9_SERVB|nr:hypothetical protein M408DRAFT_331556 [Serendipita vermifera MAFF 305830]
MSFPTPRTSSKRSFDEYGNAGPSGIGSSSAASSSIGGAGAGAVLGLSSVGGNHFVDPANNVAGTAHAHNTRHKRRRGSLSPPQPGNSLDTPSMPVGVSSSSSTSTSFQRQTGHSASNSAESLMSWVDDSPSQAPLPHPTTLLSEQPSSTLSGTTTQDSFFRSSTDNHLYDSRPDGEFRDNRMSWMPETTTTASTITDTVTTNTEPGWNFGPHGQHHLGPPMGFSMPNASAQNTDAPSQPSFHFMERDSYNSSNNMPTPSFQSDLRPANISNFDSAHLISPRSPPSLYMDPWFRPSDSRRPIPSRNTPSPPLVRAPPPLSQPATEPTSSGSHSWWPLRWNSYIDGGTSPPPVPRRARPSATDTPSNPPHRAQPPSPASEISMPQPDFDRRPNRNRVSSLDEVSSYPWGGASETNARREQTRWPPYHLSPVESPTSHPMFPEPQTTNGTRRNNENSRYQLPDFVHPAIERRFLRSSEHGQEPTRAFGNSNDAFSSYASPLTSSTSHFRDPHAWPAPENNGDPSLYPPTSGGAAGERVHFHDESARLRNSARVPSPPLARRAMFALNDILDRHTRNHPPVDTNTRPSHHRSNSDVSPVDPYQSRLPNNVPQRRVERLEETRETIYVVPQETRSSEPFAMNRSTGPSTTTRTRNSRPEPRARPSSSFYDHPSMRDLVSSHSNPVQERERRDLHSSLAARTPLPPPTTRRTLSGIFDYTRGVNSGSNGASERPADLPEPPRASRAAPPMRSNSPVSNRLFPPVPSSRRPPSPASRPSPFRLDPFSSSPPNEPNERPTEPRSGSLRSRHQRRRDNRIGRLLGVENPFAWLGSDEDFPFYDPATLDDADISGLGITAAERMRNLGRYRAGGRALRAVSVGRMRAMGDYVLDDDFDDSYESLLALGQLVGPVKRGCSDDTLGGLPHGTYAEFSAGSAETAGDNKVLGDNNSCAICLEDYTPTDMCTKLPRCLHFYHKDCVKEWLKTAKTCPVCRENVEGPPRVKGTSRPTRVRFVPISEQRESQNPQMQHLRNTSGPSSSGAPTTISVQRSSRRRSTRDDHPIPPPPLMFESERDTNTTFGRFRRLRMPSRVESSMLGEFDDPWPTNAPPSPPSMFALHHRRTPSPSPIMMELPSTSDRFGPGSLARALHEGRFDDIVPSLHTFN